MITKTKPANEQEYILTKMDLVKGMGINRAIVQASEFIDNQADPERFANGIIQSLKVPLQYNADMGQAKILALAVVEQLVTKDVFDPELAAEYAVGKLDKISKKFPFLFKKPITVVQKKGSKRDIASKIYTDNRNLDTKSIVALIAKELDVTTQNAYTYLYNVKKMLKV